MSAGFRPECDWVGCVDVDVVCVVVSVEVGVAAVESEVSAGDDGVGFVESEYWTVVSCCCR